jgi:hypothetical protein
MQKLILISSFLLLNCTAVVVAEEPKTIRITRDWVRAHRERITLSIASEMSGRNHYSIKLLLEKESYCNTHTTFVATRTDYEKKPPDLTMYGTSISTETPTKVVSISFSENTPYSLRPIFRIATKVNVAPPESPDAWIETGSYSLDMRDFDDLHRVYVEAEKR